MKNSGFLFAVVITLICVSSCSDANSEKNPILPDLSSLGLTRAHEKIASSQMDFGVSFFKAIAKQDVRNVLVSPFSMSVDIAMMAAGADGNTLKELTNVLGFEGYSQKQIDEYYSSVIEEDSSVGEKSLFRTANALWINSALVKVGIKDDYINHVCSAFNASVTELDFSKSSMTSVVNKWGSDNTQGIIKEVMTEEPEPSTKLLITNSLLFDCEWAVPGGYAKDRQTFTNYDGKSAEIEYFKGETSFSYNTSWENTSEPAALTLNYSGWQFNMMLIVPPHNASFDEFVSNLKASDIIKWMTKGKEELFRFHIPKFSVESSINRKKSITALESMGLKSIFTTGADFSKITADQKLVVNKILQGSSIDVNNEGTTASSVSYIEMGLTSDSTPAPKFDFIINRPFVYVIMDKYQSILFMGTVTDLD